MRNADFKGVDHQIDTYFKVNNGRLKLIEGRIKNRLIYYQRENKEVPKQSDVTLFKLDPKSTLKEILTKVEIEAIDNDGTIGKDKLFEQCQFFLDLFKISQKDLVSVSYSDLLLQK